MDSAMLGSSYSVETPVTPAPKLARPVAPVQPAQPAQRPVQSLPKTQTRPGQRPNWQPKYHHTGTNQPGKPVPGQTQPGQPQPGKQQPDMPKPGTPQRGTPQRGTPQQPKQRPPITMVDWLRASHIFNPEFDIREMLGI